MVHKTKYRLIAAYRLPNALSKTFIYDSITNIIGLEHHNRKVIVLGDFNIDLSIPKVNETYCDPFCIKHGMTQLITEPTRIDPIT